MNFLSFFSFLLIFFFLGYVSCAGKMSLLEKLVFGRYHGNFFGRLIFWMDFSYGENLVTLKIELFSLLENFRRGLFHRLDGMCRRK